MALWHILALKRKLKVDGHVGDIELNEAVSMKEFVSDKEKIDVPESAHLVD